MEPTINELKAYWQEKLDSANTRGAREIAQAQLNELKQLRKLEWAIIVPKTLEIIELFETKEEAVAAKYAPNSSLRNGEVVQVEERKI